MRGKPTMTTPENSVRDNIHSDILPPAPEPKTPERIQWEKDLALNAEEEAKQKAERQKHIFACFDGKKYPDFNYFCVETKESQEMQALGYGGKRPFRV